MLPLLSQDGPVDSTREDVEGSDSAARDGEETSALDRKREGARRGGLAKAANRRAAEAAAYAAKNPGKSISDEEWRESWRNALSKGRPLPRPSADAPPTEDSDEVPRLEVESTLADDTDSSLIPAEDLIRRDRSRVPGESRDALRSRRKRQVRAKTIPVKRMTKTERWREQALYLAMGGDHEPRRPATRGECVGHEGPCPFVSCAHHLYLDVSPATGAVKLNFPDLEPWDLEDSCTLDVADRGGTTLEEVGAIMNLTRERIRQVEVKGLKKVTPWAHVLLADSDPDPESAVSKMRLPRAVVGDVNADVHEPFFGEHYGDSVPDRPVDP